MSKMATYQAAQCHYQGHLIYPLCMCDLLTDAQWISYPKLRESIVQKLSMGGHMQLGETFITNSSTAEAHAGAHKRQFHTGMLLQLLRQKVQRTSY